MDCADCVPRPTRPTCGKDDFIGTEKLCSMCKSLGDVLGSLVPSQRPIRLSLTNDYAAIDDEAYVEFDGVAVVRHLQFRRPEYRGSSLAQICRC
jgi:hypothetical protein